MEKAYRYTARDHLGGTHDGYIVGRSVDDAMEKMMRAGLSPIEITFDFEKSVSVMTSFGFNMKELSRIYRSLGRRIAAGSNILESLDRLTKFTEDVRLSTALSLAAAAMRDGATLGEAMKVAGFPERDSAAVEAMGRSGRADEVLESLAEDVERSAAMRSNIKKILWIPIIFFVIAYLLSYGMIGFFTFRVLAKVEEIAGEDALPGYAKGVYALSKWANEHLVLFTVIYLAIAVSVVLFLRWDKVRQAAIRHIGILNNLSMYLDHARLWRSFALLYEAGVNPSRSAELVADSAIRDENREKFQIMARSIGAGSELDESAVKADFPEYVLSAVGAAAAQQGSVPEALIRFSGELYEDVDILSQKLKDFVSFVMLVFMAVVLLGFFMVTYYPILSAVMSQI